MKKLGFKELVPDEFSSHIITTYLLPEDPNFSFKGFYTRLAELGNCNFVMVSPLK
jgi:2-aminoethylphosphonate-pyruvate transaminase